MCGHHLVLPAAILVAGKGVLFRTYVPMLALLPACPVGSNANACPVFWFPSSRLNLRKQESGHPKKQRVVIPRNRDRDR